MCSSLSRMALFLKHLIILVNGAKGPVSDLWVGTCSWSAPAPHVKLVGTRSRAIRRGAFRRVFRNVWHGRDALPRDPQQHGPMIVSGAAPPMVDALRRVRCCMSRRVICRFCHARSRVPIVSALSIIAPPVNVLRRTRWKPSTIKGAAPDVVIGQSTAARAGAHPYRRRRSGSVLSFRQCIPRVVDL